jgi:G3E family GTPase
MTARTPVALITGSLGSGKTTLLRRILATSPRRLAILMNEFGEVAIDSRIIQGENVDIVELAGGCVCCSLTGEFEAAVTEIIGRFSPELIVVEATGVAESDALVYEVEDRLPAIRLDAVICVVDALAAVEYPQVGYAARMQLATADVLLINKTDLVRQEQVDQVVEQVRRFNTRASCIRTVRCAAAPDLLSDVPRTDRPVAQPSPHLDFESFAVTSAAIFDRERFERFVADLPGSVFRAKGFIRFPGETLLFNYVAGRAEFESFDSETTQLVFIGPGLARDRKLIETRVAESEL